MDQKFKLTSIFSGNIQNVTIISKGPVCQCVYIQDSMNLKGDICNTKAHYICQSKGGQFTVCNNADK